MGIDAQRSGASELPDRAVEVRRGRTAYAYRVVVRALRGTQGANSGPGNWQRKSTQAPSTTKAIPVWIVEEEQSQRSPAFWAVQSSPNGRWQSPAFWAVQPSPNGRWQSPARPMRLSVLYGQYRVSRVCWFGEGCTAQFPSGSDGTWTAVPRLRRGRGQAAGPSGPAAVAATGGSRRSGSSLPSLDDVHRHRLRAGARASAPAALGTRPLVVFQRPVKARPSSNAKQDPGSGAFV